jgi:hypothetical protein
MIGGAKGIGIGIDFGIPNQYCRATSKPYIEKDVLDSLRVVASAYGKSNNDADRSIVKNLVDASNPFVISNAAFKLNSGFGKYEITFQYFPYIENVTNVSDSKVVFGIGGQLLIPYSAITENIPSFKIKVNGLSGTYHFRYYYRDSNGAQDSINMAKDGIYELPICYNVQSSSDGTNCGFANNGNDVVTITQIPSFQGAFVTDGIDDLITSTKTVEEMLGGSNEITVVSMIHQIDKPSNFITTNNIRTSGSVVGRNAISLTDKTGIYGWYKDNIQGSTINVINNILGDKADYTASASSNTNLSSKFSVVGYISNDSIVETSQVAWYWTIIANKVLTTDQINQVIAYFNLDRTLKPDILCDVKKQGITNDNHAEFGDKLIDFSGNGRDIQLNNIAWKGDSGIGKYEVDFLDSSIWNSSNSTITSSKIDCKNAISHIMLLYYSVGSKEYPDIPSFKVIKTGADIDYSYIDETGSPKSVKIVDGVNILPASHNTLYSGSGRFCGFGNPGMGNSVTITQIPSHAGGLCLDGINDFGKVTGMPVYKDYTVVTDREIFANIGAISSKNNPGAFVETAGNSVYSFGQATSGLNFISTRSISYLSKYSYCGQSITAGAAEDGTDMWLGTIRDNDSRFFNGAIYSLMSFPYSMSEFLIERQLKKHKLGTLYPNMMEFRPIIKSNIDTLKINYWDKDWNVVNVGDYVSVGNDIKTNITVPNGYKVSKVTSDAFDNITIEKSSTDFIYDVKFYGIKKSPQKINLTIEQDENYVKWNPVINSNIEYKNALYYIVINGVWTRINSGDYINIKERIAIAIFPNGIDELVSVTSSDLNNIPVIRINNNGEFYYFLANLTSNSPQNIDITIDEYIRYEDIVQPYPSIINLVSIDKTYFYTYGDKLKVGDVILYNSYKNLLKGLYSLNGQLKYNGVYIYDIDGRITVAKEMVFSWTVSPTYLLDNNEPKCILSPSRLRIPNSSYKLLGYIPDISGHGNHGIIHNSAYAEGSGVNEDGSYQFDGVDDFINIPTLSSGGKQVLMKINWQSGNGDVLYDQRTSTEGLFAITAASETIAYNYRNAGGNTYIDGVLNKHILSEELASITHNIILNNDYTVTNSNIFIGTNYANTVYAKMSLYDFMLFDDISTDDKIKELNEYVGIEAKVELPPYYWDTYGKTNLDADKATIQQRGVAIGDYDLTNYNHAYEGMSGYNGYPVVFGANKTWANESNGYVTSITSNTIHITNVLNAGLALLYSYVKYNGNLQNIKEIPPFKIEIKGLEGTSKFIYKYLATSDATKETNLFLGNGTHELPKSFLPTEALINDAVIGFSISPIEEGVTNFLSDITIEVLPKYENGLVYDGIEDYSVNTNIPALTDYTYVIKRENLNNNVNSATMYKGNKVGGGAFIVDYIASNGSQQYSYGNPTLLPLNENTIIYGTKTSYNGSALTVGSNTDENGLDIGHWSSNYKSIVLYKLVLYPKTIPLLQINFLKNLMEKDEIIDLTNPIFIQ